METKYRITLLHSVSPKTLRTKFDRIIINSLPNDKILDWSKSKGFADDKIIVNQKIEI